MHKITPVPHDAAFKAFLTQTDWLEQLQQGNLPDRLAADATELQHILNEIRDTQEGTQA